MDKGPHTISFSPGSVSPVIHVSEGEHGEKLKLYFKILDTDGTYYSFTPLQDGTPSSKVAGDLYYVRPDGEEGSVTVHVDSQTVYVLSDRRMYADPHTLVLREVPEHLTAVAGDVICEIRATDETDGNKSVGYTANFIVRVEPKPSAITHASGGGGESEEESNDLTWTNIKARAKKGTLNTLLTLGQEIDGGEKITVGGTQYPLTFQVVDLTANGAVFDLKYPALFGAVSAGIGAYDNYLSTELKRVVSKGLHPGLHGIDWNSINSGLDVPSYQQVAIGGTDTPSTDTDYGLTWDYYKTRTNRVKTSIVPNGEFSAWATRSKRSDVAGWNGNYLLLVDNSGYLISYTSDNPSEIVGYTVCFQIDNTNESDWHLHENEWWKDIA